MKFWKKTLEKRRRIKKINTIELQKESLSTDIGKWKTLEIQEIYIIRFQEKTLKRQIYTLKF